MFGILYMPSISILIHIRNMFPSPRGSSRRKERTTPGEEGRRKLGREPVGD